MCHSVFITLSQVWWHNLALLYVVYQMFCYNHEYKIVNHFCVQLYNKLNCVIKRCHKWVITIHMSCTLNGKRVCIRCWWCSTSDDTELWCPEIFQPSSRVWNTSARPPPRLLLSTNKLRQRYSREHLSAGRWRQQSRSLRVSRPQQSALLCVWCWMSWSTRAAQVWSFL